ncbi:aldehyde dehydrogenase family protein [Sandaracinus amylolyticus]|uniref:aldehyde dehydrogenase family protein n=1 Tax=Sandaracinus amylolyticus TaxID=927083 RepID=UPI001F1ED60F|nr:aldehyde dehydrogenase family protein [Sandaracinus amylolyticus]UJR80984.1 Betaine-aldehyde dehydrogenase [Sandaracinus amylolyticus]
MDGSLIKRVFETMEYGPAPEADGPAKEWLDRHERRFGHYIGGSWRPANEHFATNAPGRKNAKLADIAQGTDADVDAAVQAATKALPAWQKLGGHGRARYLYAIARHVQKHARLLSVLESLDNGKPIRESRDVDVPLVARHFYHHAGWAQLMESELPDSAPIGVVGQIIPWNFPLLMLAWKIAPALAMGNTLVLKPAELTPLTALLFAEICHEVGLPPGVVNIVTGDGRTGAALTAHPGVAKIAFTGSTEVGRIIRKATAGTGKKLSMELGGKSPFVVFEDADLDSVVEGVVDAIWFNQGQVCCAGSRILAQESVAPELLAKLRARMETLRVGDPLDKAIDIGAIVAPVQLERIQELVKQGVDEGASLWQPSWSCPTDGVFYPPTVLSDVQPASTVAQVEIFGPVVVFMTFRTPEEAVSLANNTTYGLAASVWTESLNLALDVAPKIKAGTVWINCTNVFDAASGFGGYRESGYGREGGKEGLYEYVKPRWMAETKRAKKDAKSAAKLSPAATGLAPAPQPNDNGVPAIDRTAKLYIGGKQARPDGSYVLPVLDPKGRVVGHVGQGNRKDLRNAVEAAHAASGWSKQTAHLRAQVLYYLAENLEARSAELAERIAAMTGDRKRAQAEVKKSVERLFTYGAWADKHDGLVHATPHRNVTIAMNEPIGVVGIVCGDAHPLLGFVSAVAPCIAMGNTVVVVPSERAPLAATDLYQVFDTSDLPGGVVNIVTGTRDELAPVLAAHDGVDSIWYLAEEGPLVAAVESASAGNMKRTFCGERDWMDDTQGAGRELLREATQVKNIWVPYGE